MKTFDICIIGAGSGGLSVAAGAAQLGASVVLIEEGNMGGDCLNDGCVPSKALLHIAKTANIVQNSNAVGISTSNITMDDAKIYQYINDTIQTIAPHDSAERFEKMGATVITGHACFIDRKTVMVKDQKITARKFVIATGSRPIIPPVPGLDSVDYLTNETIFTLKKLPQHLIILGGGPIGCEMAFAHKMLGCKVTLIQRSKILKHDEPECVDIIRNKFTQNEIDLFENTEINRISKQENSILVETPQGNISGSHLLVAIGRTPDIANLNLEKAGIKHDKAGILVDHRLRTTNKKIFAIGDVVAAPHFTHVAGYHASIVIQNALFHWPAKVNYRALPWCTYIEPELAHIGLTEQEAQQKYSKLQIIQKSFSDIDRAQTDNDATGLIKIVATKKGSVLGTSIVGQHAGELLMPWSIAITNQLKLKKLASLIVAYPTLSEINKQAAAEFYKPILFSSLVKNVVKFLKLF